MGDVMDKRKKVKVVIEFPLSVWKAIDGGHYDYGYVTENDFVVVACMDKLGMCPCELEKDALIERGI